ncbi:AAA family ATPase [Williamwhitmania taraxaci]|uniref:Predicted ATPase n=1 Tax=Williamwhitmania taraxaci TaxID=1640674 RepID=A0A1G6GUC7_9BACT|nr:AAA family ATPase [Williamwhitmania taraxaci]SDB85622.1 Predicted ATPase [Williamwhitmania taraxaci]
MIEYIEIEGYKSIKQLKLEMRPINILIGSNGVGKSNFISFFKLVNAIFNQQLQRFVMEEKADNLLYFGRKTTNMLYGKLIFTTDNNNNNGYLFALSQNKEGGLFFWEEGSGYNVGRDISYDKFRMSYDLAESRIKDSDWVRDAYLRNYLTNLQVFHFHDTSATSYLRRECDINDNAFLKQDGRNLPAFLYFLKIKHPIVFARIEKTIQSVAPYISKFILEPNRLNEKEIELRWVDRGDLDSNFSAYQLSDGTLRFIALATLLMQPEPPAVIVIDEPELGLHPFAIGKLAAMMQVAASKTQIVVATQSPGLISHFSPEDVVVMDKSVEENQTIFTRLSSELLEVWLKDYTLGDLWERNILNAAQPFTK